MFGKKDDWQSKYKALVRESEQHVQTASRALSQMRSLSTQLDLALHGQSSELDLLLQKLKAELEANRLDKVQDLLRKTEKQVLKLEGVRAKSTENLLKQLRDWANLLLLQDSEGSFSTNLDDIKHDLETGSGTLDQMPKIVASLLEVQKKLSSPTVIEEPSNDLSQLTDVVSARLATRMLELLQQMNVPSEYARRAHLLIKRLETASRPDELETCLQEMSDLMRVCGGNLEEDIQNYLLNLNEQLAYLRRFVDSSDTLELKQRKRNNLLDQTVRQDVSKIHHVVQNTHDINDLKRSVSAQLASIIKAMNQHKIHEEEHLKTLQQEKAGLVSQLNDMEHKAESFRKQAEDAHVESRTDPLTGLPNRRVYDERFADELERFERYDTPFALCVGDIDRFKTINDQYGHLAGDKVLRLVAKVLRQNLRGVDLVARYGGEEFVILMPSTSAESARQAAEKIRQAVEQSPFNFQGQPVHITISFGITEARKGDNARGLFARADSAVYAAKGAGRNCVQVSE